MYIILYIIYIYIYTLCATSYKAFLNIKQYGTISAMTKYLNLI